MSKRVLCVECVFSYKDTVWIECRIMPPTVILIQYTENLKSVWPRVKKDDWCGQGIERE